MNKNIFRKMSYGVYVTATMDGSRPVACITNSIMQITSEPATVAVSVNHGNYTNGCIEKAGMFAFSILSEQSDPGLIGTFGFRSGRDTDKFAGVDYALAAGMPVIKDSCGYVVCKVIDKMETATHTVFLGEVVDADIFDADANEMTYAYYHNVVKGKSPKAAPTYLPDDESETAREGNGAGEAAKGASAQAAGEAAKGASAQAAGEAAKDASAQAAGEAAKDADAQETAAQGAQKKESGKWVCQICGYVYEGDELPADFKCPICGFGVDQFKKLDA